MSGESPGPVVVAVSRKAGHGVDKPNQLVIRLVEGRGVEGDAHFGVTVKHRSRVRQNPDQPNLRQVHLIHAELHEELAGQGFRMTPGLMAACLGRGPDGEPVRKAGVMAVVVRGGEIRAGDPIAVEPPAGIPEPLRPV